MVARAYTVAFEGVEARMVEVQCSPSPPACRPSPSSACPTRRCREARERVRAALHGAVHRAAVAAASPSTCRPPTCRKRARISTCRSRWRCWPRWKSSRATRSKTPSPWANCRWTARLMPVIGALPAAMAAAEEDRALLCPRACGAEAAWVGATQVLAAGSLAEVVRHFTGQAPLTPAEAGRGRRPAAPAATCATSRARNAPNARWKSPPPGGIT